MKRMRLHYPMPVISRMLSLSASGYYAWRERPLSKWAREETRLDVEIRVAHRRTRQVYGAEKLLGRGDMLYMPTEASKPKRLQGCFVSDAETERLVYFWGSQKQEEAAQLKVEEVIIPPSTGKRAAPARDSLLETARELVEEHTHISTSFLQRKLRIGYPRAARIMEQLDEEDRDREGEG